MKISFDIGGVLSKYPELCKALIGACFSTDYEVHVITDMHNMKDILEMLAMNGLGPDVFPPEFVHSADYLKHGERAKQVLLEELGIDIHIDDFAGYAAAGGAKLNLFVWPNPDLPYWADTWKTNPKDGEFGRRRPAPKGGASK